MESQIVDGSDRGGDEQADERVIFWAFMADTGPVLWNLIHRALPFMGRRLLSRPDLTAGAKQKWIKVAIDGTTILDGLLHAYPGPAMKSIGPNTGKTFMNYGRLHREDGEAAFAYVTNQPGGGFYSTSIWCERGRYLQYPRPAIKYIMRDSPGGGISLTVRIKGGEFIEVISEFTSRGEAVVLAEYIFREKGRTRRLLMKPRAGLVDEDGAAGTALDYDEAEGPEDSTTNVLSGPCHYKQVKAAVDGVLLAVSTEVLSEHAVVSIAMRKIYNFICA